MSWGRGVSNEEQLLSRNQRHALGPQKAAAMQKTTTDVFLRCVQHPDPQITLATHQEHHDYAYDPTVYLNAQDMTEQFHHEDNQATTTTTTTTTTNTLFVHVRQFPKMVVRARAHKDVPPGHVYMSEMTSSNLEVTNRDIFPFRKFDSATCPNLRMIHVEIRPREMGEQHTHVEEEEEEEEGSSEEDEGSSAEEQAPQEPPQPPQPPQPPIPTSATATSPPPTALATTLVTPSSSTSSSSSSSSSSPTTINALHVRDLLVSTLFGTIVTQFERLLLHDDDNQMELIATISETR